MQFFYTFLGNIYIPLASRVIFFTPLPSKRVVSTLILYNFVARDKYHVWRCSTATDHANNNMMILNLFFFILYLYPWWLAWSAFSWLEFWKVARPGKINRQDFSYSKRHLSQYRVFMIFFTKQHERILAKYQCIQVGNIKSEMLKGLKSNSAWKNFSTSN